MKKLNTEIKKYLNQSSERKTKINEKKYEKKVFEIIPKKIQKGIKEVEIKNQTIYIKTKTPSWRQETTVLKKEILEKIHKKVRNYTISKIIIL